MATHQITASQIRPGSTIILRGKIEYARVPQQAAHATLAIQR